MTWMNVVAMLVWTVSGAVTLFILMCIDSLFTKYKDLAEMKKGNVAVATRFAMKLFAQGYILSQSILKSNDLWQALLASVISFFILVLLQFIVQFMLQRVADFDLDEGTLQGKVAYALVGGSLHVVGALILAACL